MKKNCFWVNYTWVIVQNQTIISKIKYSKRLELDLSHYATKKELDHPTGADTPNLVAKKAFIAMTAEVEKLDIKKLVNVPTSLNNLKTKVDGSNVGKLKTWKN